MRRHHLSGLAAVVLLVAPASAVAQSAGDDQYGDPFSAEKPAHTAKAPMQAAAQPASASADAEAQDAVDTPGSKGKELPRTGPHLEATVALGLLLTASGAALLGLPGRRRGRRR